MRHQEGRKLSEDWVSPVITVKGFHSFSAHADSKGLLAWLGAARGAQHVFLVHGEERQAMALAKSIRTALGLEVTVPRRGDGFVLTPRKGAVAKAFVDSPAAGADTLKRKGVATPDSVYEGNE